MTPERVVKAVSQCVGVSETDIVSYSARSNGAITIAKQITTYILKNKCKELSNNDISQLLGYKSGKDATMYNKRRVEKELQNADSKYVKYHTEVMDKLNSSIYRTDHCNQSSSLGCYPASSIDAPVIQQGIRNGVYPYIIKYGLSVNYVYGRDKNGNMIGQSKELFEKAKV